MRSLTAATAVRAQTDKKGRTKSDTQIPSLLGTVSQCPFSVFLAASLCLVTINLMFLTLSLRVQLDPTGKRFGSSLIFPSLLPC